MPILNCNVQEGKICKLQSLCIFNNLAQMWNFFLLSQFHACPRVRSNKCWHSWLSLINKEQAVWNTALKQDHGGLQACYCQSWIRVYFQRSPGWDILARSLLLGRMFSWKMLFICSLIVTAYTFYNNSNILNLGTSLKFTDAFCALSHTTLGQACLFLTQEEIEAQKEKGFNQNHKATKSQRLDLNPGFLAPTYLFLFYKSFLESSSIEIHDCDHYTCRW